MSNKHADATGGRTPFTAFVGPAYEVSTIQWSNRCAACRHFDQDGTPYPTWGHCQQAKGAGGAPVRQETRAFASDVTGYGARLNVAPDYGCTMWEEK